MNSVQTVEANQNTLAIIVQPDAFGDGTEYITPDDYPLQMGLLSYELGEQGVPHWHPDREQENPTHQEAIIVMSGSVEVKIYDNNHELVETVVVDEGGSVFFADGGRGWIAKEDTEIIELNLGPYLGLGENKQPIDHE